MQKPTLSKLAVLAAAAAMNKATGAPQGIEPKPKKRKPRTVLTPEQKAQRRDEGLKRSRLGQINKKKYANRCKVERARLYQELKPSLFNTVCTYLTCTRGFNPSEGFTLLDVKRAISWANS